MGGIFPVNRRYGRNFVILLIDAVTYAAFCALWDVNTVIPLFLDQIGSPLWMIGAANTIKQLGYLIPQPIVAARLHSLKSLAGFVRTVMLLDRPQLLVFVLVLVFTSNKVALLVIFFICFTFLCFGEGTILIAWMDLMGRTVEPFYRGLFWGAIQVIGGLVALAAGFVITHVLDNPRFPYPGNFITIFGFGAALLLPSLVFFKAAEEPAFMSTGNRPGWGTSFIRCLDNRQFMLLIFVQHLAGYDSLAIPYYIIMVRHKFLWLVQYTGRFVLLSIIGGVVGGILWAVLSDKQESYKTVSLITFIKVCAAALFLTTQIVHSRTAISLCLGLGFVLVGMATAAWVGFVNYILNITTHAERPFYLALDNAILLPVAFFPVLGSFIRGYAGDLTLYVITTIAMTIAFILSLQMKPK